MCLKTEAFINAYSKSTKIVVVLKMGGEAERSEGINLLCVCSLSSQNTKRGLRGYNCPTAKAHPQMIL